MFSGCNGQDRVHTASSLPNIELSLDSCCHFGNPLYKFPDEVREINS